MIQVQDHPFRVEVSASVAPRGTALATSATQAYSWHCEQLGWMPDVRLTVADEEDWDEVAPIPIFGVPQTWTDHVILAGSNAPLFDAIADALQAHAPGPLRSRLIETYGDPMQLLPFFDLFLYHELVHLFCEQRPGRPGPMWLTELLCNLGMVGYLSTNDPDSLPVLRAAVEASAHLPDDLLAVRGLEEMDRSFDAGSLNFGWYILRLCAMADVLWDVAGVDLYRGLYDLLHPAQGDRGEEPWTTDEIAGLSPALVDLSAAWPTFG